MLPSNAWKSTEVGVGRNHRAAVLDRNRRVLGVYQDIYVGKQHLDSPIPMPEPDFVILRVKRSRPVEIDARTGANAAHGHQPERRRLRRLTPLQRVVQRLGDKGAYAHAAGCGCTSHLLCKPVVKRNRGPHDAEA